MDEGAKRRDRGDLRAHPGARDDARAHPRDRVEGIGRDAERRARRGRALRVPQAGPAGQPVQAGLARDRGRAGPPDRRSGGAREGDRHAARRHGFRAFSGRQARRLLAAGRQRRDRHAPRRRPAKRQAADRADRPDPHASAAWLDDGSGFFYSRLREGYEKYPVAERFDDHARHFRSLADAQGDRNVFSPLRDAGLGLPRYASGDPYQIAGTKLAANRVYFGVDPYQALYLGDLDAATKGTATWTKVVGVDDKAVEIGIAGGYVYLRTSKRAPRFEIVRMSLSSPDPARADVVVPASERVIVAMRAARDALYVVRRDGATHSLWRLKHEADAKPERIALPFEGAIELTGASDRLDGVVFDLGGWTRATKPWTYDPSVGMVAQLPFVAPGAYDAPDDIMAREIRYRSHDGVEVPMSIVMRKDVKLDGTNPTILYGYGAYGITEDPFLNPRWYAWVQRGGVLAFAHVRGGGAFGEEWHLAGRKATSRTPGRMRSRPPNGSSPVATRASRGSASTAAAPAASSSAARSPSGRTCSPPRCPRSGSSTCRVSSSRRTARRTFPSSARSGTIRSSRP
ncbi:MAG: hypothetical protein IPF73_09425 [Betaproteobacteria bacterium]|nr:hypothetical protein [Betaproteobacteria bacterium]